MQFLTKAQFLRIADEMNQSFGIIDANIEAVYNNASAVINTLYAGDIISTDQMGVLTFLQSHAYKYAYAYNMGTSDWATMNITDLLNIIADERTEEYQSEMLDY